MDFNSLFSTVDCTDQYTPADVESTKVFGGLSYLAGGLLFFLPLCVNNNSAFGKFHANQALSLLIFDIIIGVVGAIISKIPLVGGIISLLLSLVVIVLMIIGIMNGVQGKAKTLPLIGGLFNIIK